MTLHRKENHFRVVEGLGRVREERDQRRARVAGPVAEECGGGR